MLGVMILFAIGMASFQDKRRSPVGGTRVGNAVCTAAHVGFPKVDSGDGDRAARAPAGS